MVCSSALKNAVALSVNTCSVPSLSGPSALKQWIFSLSDPSIGNETAQVLLRHLGGFPRLIDLSTQLRLEGALIRPAGVILCSVSAIQLGPQSNAGAPIKPPWRLIKNQQF